MNIWLIISSVLTFVLGIGHTVLGEWRGERVLVKKIQNVQLFETSEKDILAKNVVRLAWHATSIIWCGVGAIFLYAAFIDLNSQIIIIRILSISFLLTGLLSLITVPQKTILFIMIAATSWMGTL